MDPNNLLVTALTQHSNHPKNLCFRNTSTHKYNLRSQEQTIPHHIADLIFNYQYTINHIYNDSRKRETVDSLITGKNKET